MIYEVANDEFNDAMYLLVNKKNIADLLTVCC